MIRLRTMFAFVGLLTGLFSASGVHAAAQQQKQVPSGWKQVTWQGTIISYNPKLYAFSGITSDDSRVRVAAALTETPNPCTPSTADCVRETITFRLYPNYGLDLHSWIARYGSSVYAGLEHSFTDAVIADRQAVRFTTVWDLASRSFYVVPLGSDMLVIDFWFDQRIVQFLQFTQPAPNQLTVGQTVMTKPAQARDLWTTATGGTRVYERPKLYGGTPLKILAIEPKAVFVSTSDSVTGWIHAAAAEALTARAVPHGEQARFDSGLHAQIVHTNAIPLRESPQSKAQPLFNLTSGQQVIQLGVRGDWLRVYVPARDAIGWARWYYDGARYIDVAK